MPKSDLISIEDLSRAEIELLLDTAESFLPVLERDIKKVPTLRGRTIINLFWEASTRTSSSFDLAAKRLSADTLALKASGSAVEKGETLKDTAITLSAYSPDIIVMRHPSAGACQTLSANTEASVINAGDGKHQHPTQCLLDLFSMRQNLGRDLQGLRVFIIGDILHSRVARSDIMGFQMLGMDVTLVAPPTLMPRGIEEMGVKVEYDLANLKDADVIYLLRIQKERIKAGANFLPSLREYSELYGISQARLRPGQRVMHPGPINRGVEIAADIADDDENLIAHQVFSGLAVRMAILYRTIVGYSDGAAERGGALMERTWSKSGPAADLLIKGGRVVDPAAGIDAVQDVLVTKGKVAELGKELKPGKTTRVVDARDMLVLPGFVDLHAHLRTPGREDEEDIATGSQGRGGGRLRGHLRHGQHRSGGRHGQRPQRPRRDGPRRGRDTRRVLRGRHPRARRRAAHRDGRARRGRRCRLQRRRASSGDRSAHAPRPAVRQGERPLRGRPRPGRLALQRAARCTRARCPRGSASRASRRCARASTSRAPSTSPSTRTRPCTSATSAPPRRWRPSSAPRQPGSGSPPRSRRTT